MSVAQRRNFLKGFGLVGAVASGFYAPVVIEKVKEVSAPVPLADPKILAQIAEQAPATLTLTSTYGEVAPPPPPKPYCPESPYVFIGSDSSFTSSSSLYVMQEASGGLCVNNTKTKFVPGTEKQVDVKMVPGPDGELYLNVNGVWKKVLTA
jgi:hypothetical protein